MTHPTERTDTMTTDTQLRRRSSTVQERRADGPMDPWGVREWSQWRTIHRCALRSQADAIIARRQSSRVG